VLAAGKSGLLSQPEMRFLVVPVRKIRKGIGMISERGSSTGPEGTLGLGIIRILC